MEDELDASLARLRGLIARELEREFPGTIVRPLREGGWVATYHGIPVAAGDAVMLRAKLVVVRVGLCRVVDRSWVCYGG